MSKGKSQSHTAKGIKRAETGAYRSKEAYAIKGARDKVGMVKREGSVRGKKESNSALSDNAVYESNTKYEHLKHIGRVTKNVVFFRGRTVHAVPVSEKISIIKNGISKEELETIKEESNLDYDTLSSILSVSKAKLHSKKGAEKFDQNTSERIMLLADVVAFGQSVFEDKDAFNEWLKTSNTALGNKAPVDLMDTMYGIDEVRKEIGRIEYGVF